MKSMLRPLIIGDLRIEVPIIQGGMGVRVSTSTLAAAVAECGAAGTIASVGLPMDTAENRADVAGSTRAKLKEEIKTARSLTKGVVGVNVMVALTDFEDIARGAAEANADYIISGAGLPLSLPEYTEGYPSKLIPMISSARGAEVLLKGWKRRYNRLPDAIVVEGPLSGGHIGGHSLSSLVGGELTLLENSVREVLSTVREYEKRYGVTIPVIAAGGIFDGKDMARFLKMGASGVQIGTRFIATNECSADPAYKKLFVEADENSLVFIQSPVGLPARVIRTKFIDEMLKGATHPISCNYRCLRTCNPETAPFCIAKALIDAVEGDIDNAVVFASSYVAKIKKIVPVKELIEEITSEAALEMKKKGEE
ncbi:MAG: nitronate monooxygenase family protein [Candidatus Omnitrophica bacterium]|nr:nitronate monooxygenase family protein [Candidatus Omnitrophota bacterium]